ncbi:hypothetical protein HY29_17580 [Hyphomonas beringensis]|uniref:Uncharacterized protein n=1 Tax=Hyphomonas beringensis TaxID=1280946 RepID=A0A062U629_9PROT|nr:hypothetical protein HY29_17580 [Hyphomonas beringensis]
MPLPHRSCAFPDRECAARDKTGIVDPAIGQPDAHPQIDAKIHRISARDELHAQVIRVHLFVRNQVRAVFAA